MLPWSKQRRTKLNLSLALQPLILSVSIILYGLSDKPILPSFTVGLTPAGLCTGAICSAGEGLLLPSDDARWQ